MIFWQVWYAVWLIEFLLRSRVPLLSLSYVKVFLCLEVTCFENRYLLFVDAEDVHHGEKARTMGHTGFQNV